MIQKVQFKFVLLIKHKNFASKSWTGLLKYYKKIGTEWHIPSRHPYTGEPPVPPLIFKMTVFM
jgi:hypothetical protein